MRNFWGFCLGRGEGRYCKRFVFLFPFFFFLFSFFCFVLFHFVSFCFENLTLFTPSRASSRCKSEQQRSNVSKKEANLPFQ